MRLKIAAIGVVLVALAAPGLTTLASTGAQDQAQKTATCTLQVTGMTCGGCAVAVKMAALKVDGVKDATVSYEDKRADITYDPAKTNPEAIAKAVTEKSGFTASVQKKTNK